MKNQYELKTVNYDYMAINYFYTGGGTGEKRRYHVFIIDPDGPAVYETFFNCYESEIPQRVIEFFEMQIGVTVPF